MPGVNTLLAAINQPLTECRPPLNECRTTRERMTSRDLGALIRSEFRSRTARCPLGTGGELMMAAAYLSLKRSKARA